MGEVGLVFLGPEVDVFYAFEPALVVEGGGEFAEPGAHSVGEGVEDPDADFGVAGDAVFPAILFFEADAEESDDGLVAHGGAVLFCSFSHEPGGGEAVAGLAVGDEHGSAAAGFDGVEGEECAAAVVGDGGGFGIVFANLSVPEIEKGDEALLGPEEVGAAGGVLDGFCAGKIEAGGGFEVLLTVLAVAVSGAVPTVEEEAVWAVAGHDLFVDGGHEFEVVGAVGAGDPHLGRGPVAAGLAVRVDGDPVGVGGLGVVVGGVGIGADEDGHAEVAASGDEFAEDVAVVEPGAAVVEGDGGGVVGDAASAAEADSV